MKLSIRNLRNRFKVIDVMHSVAISICRIPVIILGALRDKEILLNKNYKKLSSYKEKHNGESCVIVVNGPSLKTSDLDIIEDKITFGCNKIYQLFDRTQWRPTYYCVLDINYIKLYQDEIFKNIDKNLVTFTNNKIYDKISDENKKGRDIIYSKQIMYKKFKAWAHLLRYTYGTHQGSVLSMMMATAIYMGFKEIYVLGADNTATVAGNHFIGYKEDKNLQRIHEQRVKKNNWNKDHWKNQMSFEMDCFRTYADNKNIKIYNVTREGRLESFIRKDFDKVFNSSN